MEKTSIKLGCIILIGAILRLFQLGEESIFIDEGITVELTRLSFTDMIVNRASNFHAPLYFIFMHLWVTVFGVSEVSIRLPSVIFGVASIYAIFLLANKMFKDENIALLSAFLMAISYYQIRYSQDARMYSLFTLLAIMSMYYFIDVHENPLMLSKGYLISTGLLLYTHIYAMLLVLFQGIFLFVCIRNFRVWFKFPLALITIYFPWLLVAIRQFMVVKGGGHWLTRPSLLELLHTFKVLVGDSWILLFLYAFLVISGFGRGKTNSNLLMGWFITLTIIPFIFSWLVTPIYRARYTIGSIPPLLILVALGIRERAFDQRIPYFPVIIGCILIFSSWSLYDFYTTPHKEQWREVASYIEQNERPDDVIIITSGGVYICLDYYYRGELVRHRFPEEIEKVIEKEHIPVLQNLTNQSQRVWVVLSHEEPHAQQKIEDGLKDHFEMSEHQKFLYIDVILFNRT